MSGQCVVHRLGLLPYQEAWELQNRLAAEIAAGERPPTLLLLEHPHTYTFGRRGQKRHLLWDENELSRRGVSVHWVDRGGDITYHGPGQLVGYPLLPLLPGGLHAGSPRQENELPTPHLPRADYIGYLRRLEKTLILALDRLGLTSSQIDGLTGAWVQPDPCLPAAKIAAIGVKVDVRGVSLHGFALNVNPDMSYWQGIVACGLADYPAASLAGLLDPPPSMEQVMEAVVSAFGEVFDYQMVSNTV